MKEFLIGEQQVFEFTHGQREKFWNVQEGMVEMYEKNSGRRNKQEHDIIKEKKHIL